MQPGSMGISLLHLLHPIDEVECLDIFDPLTIINVAEKSNLIVGSLAAKMAKISTTFNM